MYNIFTVWLIQAVLFNCNQYAHLLSTSGSGRLSVGGISGET